jgi:chemotaxis protein methyltransferase CheR
MPDPIALTPAAVDGDLPLSAADFERVRQLIHRRAGISLHAGKRAMVHSRLSRRLRATGHGSFATYLQALEGAGGADLRGGTADEWQEFVSCLTTHLTSFFREPHHFVQMAHDLRARATQPIRIWCNAASTGEEPYSLAMTVCETLGASARVELVCSDIDAKVLVTARRGVYPADARGLSPERLRRHFLRGTGPNAGSIRVRPELVRLVTFRHFNLASELWDSLGAPFDIVLCRNVMIYFDRATQQRVLERTHAALKPGGLLYVGHSEHFTDARHLFRLRGTTVYERV